MILGGKKESQKRCKKNVVTLEWKIDMLTKIVFIWIAFLIMPILFPVCTALGISPATVILTYCIADGFSDVILPTNPVLLIGLSMANVSYGKWVKFTWCFQLAVFAFTVLVLLFAVGIGY